MFSHHLHRLFLVSAAVLPTGSQIARADEGMWLFNAPPRAELQARYQFDATDAWLEHLMQASVRFGTASASFVSADGLVITNHHVGRTRLQQLSTATRDLLRDGFYAPTPADELKCPGTILSVLQSIEDVTERVNTALAGITDPAAAAAARRKLYADLARESREKTGLHSTVVNLYEGGRQHLYRMKRYTDVRLVFAPEFGAAHFGGDVDNFEYPRFCLDVCFFRVYEDGRPIRPPHFLQWSATGPRSGDLIFVSGHPANTDRLLTVAELRFLRDTHLPYSLEGLRRYEVTLKNWGARDAENSRRAARYLLSVENSRKRADGQIAALQDARFLAARHSAEERFQAELRAADKAAALTAYEQIAAAQRTLARDHARYQMLSVGDAFASQAAVLARGLVSRPSATRNAGNDDAPPSESVPSTQASAAAAADPFYEDLEIVRLTASLTRLADRLGCDDPTVQKILAGCSPRARATELTRGTRLHDPAVRKQLSAGGDQALAASTDPWIVLLRGIDGEVRSLRAAHETQLEIVRRAHAAIAEARFQLRGTGYCPDATGTLRLSFGVMKGYDEDGQPLPAQTDFAGLFARAERQGLRPPFDLPARWREKRSALNPATPYNFVSTLDTVGGNSGSPIVNRAGEFVGILFDGNLPGLSRAFAYEDDAGRSIAVHSAGITEALRAVYGAEALVGELKNGRR